MVNGLEWCVRNLIGKSPPHEPVMSRLLRAICRKKREIAGAIMLRRARHALNNRMANFARPYKLHLGCGKNKFEGWVNLDFDSNSRADIIWDLTTGIPLPSGSCHLIYSEHVLEHFNIESGLALLCECYRALAPSGVMRVAMPSLDLLLEKSMSGQWREQDWLTWPEHKFIKTRAEMLNISFRWWGHKWLYDREELQRRLIEAGFSEIDFFAWGESSVEDLRHRESRMDSLLIGEARK
jgi:predicted SAM-dependent methyltransferase